MASRRRNRHFRRCQLANKQSNVPTHRTCGYPLSITRIFFTLPFQGCTQVSPNETSTNVTSTNCAYNANDNEGCVVIDPSTASFGAGFASSGGGTFVTEFATTGIRYANPLVTFGLGDVLIPHPPLSIWFFPVGSTVDSDCRSS